MTVSKSISCKRNFIISRKPPTIGKLPPSCSHSAPSLRCLVAQRLAARRERRNVENSRFSRLWSYLKSEWNPKPINAPSVDPELNNLDPLQRSTEALRYSILSLEFWIAPEGQLREWLRQNSRVAVWLTIPALLILPPLILVLWQLVKCLTLLVSLTSNLILLPLVLLLAAGVVWTAFRIVRCFFGIS